MREIIGIGLLLALTIVIGRADTLLELGLGIVVLICSTIVIFAPDERT